ncbi:MAG: hypothetical protein RIB67_11640 [Miltoncostaeaceae bacterium]
MSATAALAGAVRLPRSLIWVEGPDAGSFLHGLLSNDVAALAEGEATDTLLLDAKGHIVARAAVHRDAEEAFTLVCAPSQAEVLTAELERFHFSEDLDILGPEPADALVVPAGVRVEGAVRVPGPLPGTVVVVPDDAGAALAALGVPEVDAAVLEDLRIRSGVAEVGTDTGPSTLVQEARLQDATVSFTKGCYLGQETVARAQFRGRVNRVLRRLDLGAAPASLPAEVRHEGKVVGSLTSATTPDAEPVVGLAILRHEVGAGAAVEVAGSGPAVVRDGVGDKDDPAS